ncbi:MAG: hypothetical protein MUF18_14020 [Fimbriiglobus sp.]|jgi:hypothetical protein|nr:hypothetical protein [Fimbriiglobus sp.]
MWSVQRETRSAGDGHRIALHKGDRPASFAEVIAGWQTDPVFRDFFSNLLADTPFTAFRWETPAVSTATAAQPFECVLLQDPRLDRPPEPQAFAGHFSDVAGVVAFPNLGRDAVLVVPCPIGHVSAYCHLAAFVRHASAGQQQELWQAVGEAMARRLSGRPVWLNTAGAGVPWLHVRLDDRPKYYWHEPYRVANLP